MSGEHADGVINPVRRGQLFIGWEGGARFWAQGVIGDDEFIARAVHLLVVSIMPFANEPLRQELENEMQQLEERLTPFRVDEKASVSTSA